MKKVNKKKKTIKTMALSIFGVLFLGVLLFFTFNELYTENDIKDNNIYTISDAEKFKNSYEDLNGKIIDGKSYISVNIDNSNPIKYITSEELINKMNDKSTFLVFFGYAKNEWVRSVVENIIIEANNYNIDNIYYLDIEDIRDEYKLNDNKELELVKEGTKEYKILLDKFDSVLSSYESFKYLDTEGNEVEVPVEEKRIEAPSLVLVKDGVPVKLTSGISSLLENPSLPQTDDMIEDSRRIISVIYEDYNSINSNNTCDGISNC